MVSEKNLEVDRIPSYRFELNVRYRYVFSDTDFASVWGIVCTDLNQL